jgi:hypothetical protein
MTEIAPPAPAPLSPPASPAATHLPAPIAPSAPLDADAVAAKLADLAQRAASYAEKSAGAGTRRVYDTAWRAWSVWCTRLGRPALGGDPGLVALYLTERADDGLAVSSLQVVRAAIRAAHRLAGVALDMDDPRLALVMAGITRDKGVRPQRQAAAAVPDILRPPRAEHARGRGAGAGRPAPGHAADRLRRRAAPLGAGGAGDRRCHRD